MLNKRSKEAFITAFVSLLDEMPFRSITVQTLAARAGYSRSSFYSQFTDIWGFYKNIVNDEVNNFISQLQRFYLKGDTNQQTSSDFFLTLFEDVYLKRNLYSVIFNNENQNSLKVIDFFCRTTSEYINNYIATDFSDDLPEINQNFYVYCLLNAYVSFTRYWVKTDFEWSPKKMAEQAMLFLDKQFYGFREK